MSNLTPVNKVRNRTKLGSSMIELLVASFMMVGVSALIVQTLQVQFTTGARSSNQAATVNMVRNTVERISSVVRQGRNVGDLCGNLVTDNDTGLQWSYPSNFWPSTQNPVWWKSGQPAGFPGWPANWNAPPWSLGPQCLVVQVPVFNAQGFAQTVTPPALGLYEDVDTYVFQVLPDDLNLNNNPPMFKIEMSTFPGTRPGLAKPLIESQVLCRGIVGPIDSLSQKPDVFQLVDHAKPATIYTTVNNPSNIPTIGGVVITMAVQTTENGTAVNQTVNTAPSTFGISSEVYMRNNQNMTLSVPQNQWNLSGTGAGGVTLSGSTNTSANGDH